MASPERKYPARRILDDIGNRSNLIFVTVCSRNRNPILAKPDIHVLLLNYWQDSTQWLVGRYVIMPDHIHLFCAPAGLHAVNVRDWVGYWKSRTAAGWPRREETPVWQREAWDRQIRQNESYRAKWNYVRNNPVRAGLVSCAESWPYQGEVNPLVWHEP